MNKKEKFIDDLKKNNDKMLNIFQQALTDEIISFKEYETANKISRYTMREITKLEDREELK